MIPAPITQAQALDLIRPLTDYVGVDIQDVSKVEFTASRVSITRITDSGSVTNHIDYSGGN